MSKFSRIALVLPLVAALCAIQPAVASARTKSVVKYGAIGLGAAALYNMGQRSAYAQPHYGYGYAAPAPVYAYPTYPAYPVYAYPAYPVYAAPAPAPGFNFSYTHVR